MTRWSTVKKDSFMVAWMLALCLSPATELQASVRVNASSGTVFKVKNGTAYVLSTGHMDERSEPAVEFFYDGGKKLDKPYKLTGRTILLVENNFRRGIDFCLIEVAVGKFIPASTPLGKDVKKGAKCLSIGCDEGSDPSPYDAVVLKLETHQYLMTRNKVRGGRSGGGLFHDGRLVGVCWGSTTGGEPFGLFTRVSAVRRCLAAGGFEELLE